MTSNARERRVRDHLLITYLTENDERIEKKLDPGETLSVGRDAGVDGITLEGAAENISRVSIKIGLEDSGVSIRNTNKFKSVLVEVGTWGNSLQNLRRKYEA